MFTIGFIRTDLKYLCRVVFLVEVVVRQTDRHKKKKKKKKKKNHHESFLLLATYSANFKTVAGLDHSRPAEELRNKCIAFFHMHCMQANGAFLALALVHLLFYRRSRG